MSHRNLVRLLLGIALIGLISGSLHAEPAAHPVVPVVDATQSEIVAEGQAAGAVEPQILNLTEMFFPGMAAMTANPQAGPIRNPLDFSACRATCRTWGNQCVSQGYSECLDAVIECHVSCIELGHPSWPVGVPPYPFG